MDVALRAFVWERSEGWILANVETSAKSSLQLFLLTRKRSAFMELDYARFAVPLHDSHWLSTYTDDLDAVSLFCRKHDLISAVQDTTTLAQNSFLAEKTISLHLSQDPEDGEEVLVIDITLAGTTEEARRGYDAFIAQWIEKVAWKARQHLCLTYNLANA